jgi:DNA polymerase-1
MSKPTRVVLVDGNALLYRAHYAFISKPLTNSRGFETSGVFGFVRMIFDLKDKYGPEFIAVAWDKSKKSFRNELFAEYKGTRKETPPPLVAQFPYARQVLEGLGVRSIELEGFEADDILGTLAKRFQGPGREVLVVSGDRDILQLVDDGVHAVLTKRGISELALYTPKEIREELGLGPEQLIDLKALVGDTSDNIPGVRGIGEKTAVKLLAEHGTLAKLYENIASVKGANQTKLADGKDSALLSQKLGTIHTQAPVETQLDDCKPAPVKQDQLLSLFNELELRQFLSRPELKEALEKAVVPDVGEYATVLAKADLTAVVQKLMAAPRVALSVRTLDPGAPTSPIIGFALSAEVGHGWYVPVGHRYLGCPEQMELGEVLAALAPVFKEKPLAGEDLKHALRALHEQGVELEKLDFDTMLASYLLNPGRRKHTLDELSAEFLGKHMPPFAELIPKGHDSCQVTLEAATTYCGTAASRAIELAALMEKRLEEVQMTALSRDVEMPLVRILERMERAGIGVDAGYLSTLSRELTEEIARLEKQIFEVAGETFNIGSPLQLGRILFEKLGLPVIKKTKTGYSTDSDVLAALEADHQAPVARLINQHRHLTKLKGTYVDSLPKDIGTDGRVHTTFHQTVAATGRLSSMDPNLQNIPIRTEVGHKIRKAFKAIEGHSFVSADYSQIELRVLAHLADSPFLKNAFATGEDIHRRTASKMFGIPEDQLTSETRSRAKAINFGILYGQSAFGLSRTVGITQGEAKKFIEAYFAQFPEIRGYLDAQVQHARQKGYVTTLLNRRRYLPEIHSKNGQERSFAERIAVNTPIQGSAADLIKIAMVRVDERVRAAGMKARMLLQIHDELLFECPDDEVERLVPLVRETMEGALTLTVGIAVNVSTGRTWADLK